MITSKSFLAGCRALIDNGIDPDESPIVLQALCYILLDEETEQYMPDDEIVCCQNCLHRGCDDGPTVWDDLECFLSKNTSCITD